MNRPLGLFLALCFLLGSPVPVIAKEKPPATIQYVDLSGSTLDDFAVQAARGVQSALGHAGGGTTYYGGTTWDGVDGRWEALIDSCWTFDTGVATEIIVGSAADYQGVNPYKQVGLHAYMEGWIGIDNSFSDVAYFRILDDGAAGTVWDNVCVGADHATAPGVLGGDYSYYCGVLAGEAEALCYVDLTDKEGYGNNWKVCIGKKFYGYSGGTVTLDYDFVNETEQLFDFTRVEVDTAGNGTGITEAIAYDGSVSGHETLSLLPGSNLPVGPADSIQVRFCFVSDGAWADDDGLSATVCGAFSVDNIALSGAIADGPATFEGGASGGWELLPPQPGPGGEWSNLIDYSTVSVLAPCSCNLSGNVLVFEDLSSPFVFHNNFQDNIAGSPWIELQPGHDGPIRFIETDLYANLNLINYIFAQFAYRYYPQPCPATGQDRESPWTSSSPNVFFFGGVPTCTLPQGDGFRFDLSTRVPATATEMQIGVGVISFCRFFGDCSGQTNITPVFDNVKLGVFGTFEAPFISTESVNLPQDSFPSNGTLSVSAPARFDAGVIKNAPAPDMNTVLGDTLTVNGATGGAEVHVEFEIVPGPGIDGTALAAFYASVTPRGGGWYSARMDTAEFAGTGGINGIWMTTYHEDDPNFSGSDTDLDPTDVSGAGHLANDVFPDNLFTPGTRINLFYRTKFLTGSTWFTFPDTSAGTYLEWEALPASMSGDQEWNCVLYVDHFDGRGAQAGIENGLAAVLGTGSANYEGTNWDRYDVRASSSNQACFGRPLGTEYGATVVQALAYKSIVWNSGNLSAFNVIKEDADVLVPWLTLTDFAGNGLYLSGDGMAQSMSISAATEPSAWTLLNDIIGADLTCNTVRNSNCPPGPFVPGLADCMPLDPVSGVVASIPRSFYHTAQGNNCPQQRSFDLLELASPLYGATAFGDEEYDDSAGGGKIARWASVAVDAAAAGQPNYRVVLDGVSVHYRRDTLLGPCSFFGDSGPVTERLDEVLTYLGASPLLCNDRTQGVSTPGDMIRDPSRTSLANFAPNPLRAGNVGTIEFTMAHEGRARVDIFDVRGGLVRTVFDGIAWEGKNEAVWDATDASGRDVSSGVYFYRLNAGADVFSKMMVVVGRRGDAP